MNTPGTAVIVTFNSADQIGPTLSALAASGIRIVMVDNASADTTVSIVTRGFPDVEVIANTSNVGFATAVNQGLSRVRGETVLLVNPDCTLGPDTVTGLHDYLAAHPEVGIVGPRLVDVHGDHAVSAHPFETVASVLLSRFGGSLVPVRIRRLAAGRARRQAYDACRGPAGPTRVDWLSGAALAVRTDLLRRAGGLDERYFLYYEDEELCWQAAELGSSVVYLPSLTAVHVGGASSAVGATWPHLYRSMLMFFALHRPAGYQVVRFAVLLRAGIGIVLAAGRRLLGRGSTTGPARAAAWRQVATIALTTSRADLRPAAARSETQNRVPA